MKNIHLIESKEKSTLLYNPRHKSFCIRKEPDGMWINDGKVSGADFWSVEKAMNNGFYPYNIYIISDEEIKEGDWYLYCNQINKRIRKNPKAEYPYPNYQKIILTTDQDLIKDNVQAIDDEFLEWFVKNSSCDSVVVITEQYTQNYHKDIWYNRYKIITPEEEPKQTDENGKPITYWGGLEEPKQETLEDSIYQAIGLAANEQGIINQALATSKVMDVLKKQIYETRNT